MVPERGVALGQAMNQNQRLFFEQASSDLRVFDLLRQLVNERCPANYHFSAWGRIDHGQDGRVLLHIVRGLFEQAPNCF
jgi:hypothetical protein